MMQFISDEGQVLTVLGKGNMIEICRNLFMIVRYMMS